MEERGSRIWSLQTLIADDSQESKKELDALLSGDSVLGNKIDIPYAASEDELRYDLGLIGVTTGKGKMNLAYSNVRPLEAGEKVVSCGLTNVSEIKELSSVKELHLGTVKELGIDDFVISGTSCEWF